MHLCGLSTSDSALIKELLLPVYRFFKPLFNYHSKKQSKKDVVVLAAPRSGSTWLLELFAANKGFRVIDEPFNLRKPFIRRVLGFNDWSALYTDTGLARAIEYFNHLSNGKGYMGHFMDRSPLYRYYRLFTDVNVFKILHYLEHQILDLHKQSPIKAIFIIRHPIAVSLSRKALPRLDSFINSEISKNFNPNQLRLAKEIYQSNNFLRKAVLDWCFQNYFLINNISKIGLMITYEQLVVQPEIVLPKIIESFNLPDSDKVWEAYNRPSMSTRKSNKESKTILNSSTGRERMIEKWKNKLTSEEVMDLMQIVKDFGIDVYDQTSMPKKDYLITTSSNNKG